MHAQCVTFLAVIEKRRDFGLEGALRQQLSKCGLDLPLYHLGILFYFILIYYFLTSLLEYNRFTMVC